MITSPASFLISFQVGAVLFTWIDPLPPLMLFISSLNCAAVRVAVPVAFAGGAIVELCCCLIDDYAVTKLKLNLNHRNNIPTTVPKSILVH